MVSNAHVCQLTVLLRRGGGQTVHILAPDKGYFLYSPEIISCPSLSLSRDNWLWIIIIIIIIIIVIDWNDHCLFYSKTNFNSLWLLKITSIYFFSFSVILLFTKKNDYFHTVSFKISAFIFFDGQPAPESSAAQNGTTKKAVNLVTLGIYVTLTAPLQLMTGKKPAINI